MNTGATQAGSGGAYLGPQRVREIAIQLVQARAALCDTVNPFDISECATHLRGRPTQAKIEELHAYWSTREFPLRSILSPHDGRFPDQPRS